MVFSVTLYRRRNRYFTSLTTVGMRFKHTSKIELITQKNRLFRRFFRKGGPSDRIRTCGILLPNQARYQLRYTRIFNFCHDTTASGKNKVFSVCGHSCGQNRFCAVFSNRGKPRKRRRRKALRRFASPYPGYRHGTPKQSGKTFSGHF